MSSRSSAPSGMTSTTRSNRYRNASMANKEIHENPAGLPDTAPAAPGKPTGSLYDRRLVGLSKEKCVLNLL